MAKEETQGQPEGKAPLKFVKVRVRQAINVGGKVIRPKRDGNTLVPAEAVLTEAQAAQYSKRVLEIVGPADGPAK